MQQLLELQEVLNSITMKIIGISQTLNDLIGTVSDQDKTPLDAMLIGVQYTKMGLLFGELTDDLAKIGDILEAIYPNEQIDSI